MTFKTTAGRNYRKPSHIVLFLDLASHRATGTSGSWSTELWGKSSCSAPVGVTGRLCGAPAKWNTPFGSRWARSESLPGCWRAARGRPPAALLWLPGSHTSPSCCRGIWPISPRRPRWRRSPLQSALIKKQQQQQMDLDLFFLNFSTTSIHTYTF